MTITIQEFISREILLCVSTLVWELTQKECDCLSEEDKYELWTGPIDYGAAKYELELAQDSVFKHFDIRDNRYYFGVKNFHGAWKVDPVYNDEEQAIAEYYEQYLGDSLEDYRQEIFEHWVIEDYLARKLREHGETVVEVLGLTIWARPSTGQSIALDYVIQKIYRGLISK